MIKTQLLQVDPTIFEKHGVLGLILLGIFLVGWGCYKAAKAAWHAFMNEKTGLIRLAFQKHFETMDSFQFRMKELNDEGKVQSGAMTEQAQIMRDFINDSQCFKAAAHDHARAIGGLAEEIGSESARAHAEKMHDSLEGRS